MLKAENSLLNEENHQKSLNLDNQKQIVSLSEESNGKLNEVIQKMGDKIISLEMFN